MKKKKFLFNHENKSMKDGWNNLQGGLGDLH